VSSSAVSRRQGRGAVQLPPALLGLLPVAAVGFDNGGFFPRTSYVGSAAFAVLAVVALARGRGYHVGSLALAFVALLAGLVVLTLASAAWGEQGTEALPEAARASLYAGAALAFVLLADRGSVPWFLAGVFVGVVALCTYGLADRVVRAPAPNPFQGSLLFEPIGYANALGIVAAMGSLLGLGIVGHVATSRGRAVAVAGLISTGVALALTESRGAWLAFACGLVVLVTLATTRWRAGVRWLALGVAGALVVAALVVGPSISFGDRPAYWRAAIQDGADHPLLGSGAGSFAEYWLQHGDVNVAVRDAHSLYLETFAELGALGLSAVLAALFIPLVSVRRTHRAPLVPAACAAYVAFVVHAGLDWDWELPVTVVVSIACAAALLAETLDPPSSPK